METSVDLAYLHAISEDFPASHASFILPAGARARHYTRWSTTGSASVLVQTYCAATSAQTSLSGGKATSPTFSCDSFLSWVGAHHWWTSRHVDAMVSEWAGSVGMGVLLHP